MLPSENPGLAGPLQRLPNRVCWIAWALRTGSGTSLPHWRGLPDSLKGKWQKGAAQAFLSPSKHSGSPDPLRRAQEGTGSPATGTGGPVPSHPLQRGRDSLKGRGASQAPSLPFKANLRHLGFCSGARNALERLSELENTGNSSFRPHPGDPLTMSHCRPPDSKSTTRGKAISEGAWPEISCPEAEAARNPWPFKTRGHSRGLPACSRDDAWTAVEGQERGGVGKFEGEGGLLRHPPSPIKGKFVANGFCQARSYTLRLRCSALRKYRNSEF